jgi:thiol-disulfide isomerase/thioredoxin
MVSRRSRNSRGRFAAARPIDVRSPAQIPMLESMLGRGQITFVLVYADWCGHCQRYKPMWERLAHTPGRIANMAAVRDDMFPNIPKIAKAKIAGYPSVIKVSPNGAIERYNVNGQETNAIDSGKMRDMDAMKKEITTTPIMASKMATIAKTPESAQPLDITSSIRHEKERLSKATPANEKTTEKDDGTDIYTPVSLTNKPGFQRGSYTSDETGSVMTQEDKAPMPAMEGGGLSIAAAFASAVQSVGPAALLLAAHAILPKRGRTYKSPKRSSHRGGTRRRHRH